MLTQIKSLYHFIKAEFKYHYLKNLNPNKYPIFLEKKYKKITGKTLSLENPKAYTEKMQYAKLNLNTPLKTKLSDKYLVRDWVAEKIGDEYLIPLLGVWDNFSEINLKELPEKFVLKTNHGAGWNEIVNNKDEHDFKITEMKFNKWMNRNFAFYTDIQPHYADINPKIIAEKFIEDSYGRLPEYKFFCFNGEVEYCWFILETETQRYGNVYDLDWNLQPWKFEGRENTPFNLPKPGNYEEMIEIATKLSKGFSHVRVDLYNVDEKIYFGEMTFTTAAGYRLIIPEEYNYELGNLWDLEIND